MMNVLRIVVTAILMVSAAAAQTTSVAQLLKELDESSAITIPAGSVDFSQMNFYGGKHVGYQECYDGHELVIENKNNFSITGAGISKTHLITQPSYGHVIVFRNCNNITIANLFAGHGDEKGYCRGGVFRFENCTNVTITNVDMYGSGTEGIGMQDCSNFNISKSIIRECTYYISSMESCSNILFSGCKFIQNQEFEMLPVNNSKNVTFIKCRFQNNICGVSFPDLEFFFVNATGSSISFLKCRFSGNKATYFCNDESQVTGFKGNKVASGQFAKGGIPE
jgi:hypothetical protein